MGLFNRITEGFNRLRIIPGQTPEDKTTFAPEGESLPTKIKAAVDSGKRLDLTDILSINDLKLNRNDKYRIYEEMVADGRIGAAIEMYANDTSQFNAEGKILWVESEDSDVAAYVENLLKDLHIQENVWTHAYRLYLYGDVYLETFKSSSESGKKPDLLLEPLNHGFEVNVQHPIIGQNLERYIELVPNPANVYDLQYKGKTSGYARSEEDLTDVSYNNIAGTTTYYSNVAKQINLLSPTKFVHICLSPNINRFPEKFRLIKDDTKNKVREDGLIDATEDEGTGDGSLTFSVKNGQSVLENVYKAYQTLKLKEDSVLLERVTKSSITRIIQVELGDLPEAQKKLRLQEIKNQIEQQLMMNKDMGTIQSRPGAQASENILYTTTNNGKGVISTVNIGGDAEIGNTDDIDKSENKLYGSLLIPKGLLGADMEGSGLSNGGSLTEMNTTYARRIKRGQQALINGYTDLVNIFALAEGVGNKVVNNFQIRLTPIITVEDNRRDELLDQKVRNASSIMDLIDKIDDLEPEAKLDIILNWLTSYLGQQEAANIIKEYNKDAEIEENEEKIDEITNDNKDNITINNNFSGPKKSSFDIPDERPNLDNIASETTEVEEPNIETPEQIDLNAIQGEDLL